MQKYEVLERIGEGAYGVVLKCRCNINEINGTKLTVERSDRQIVAMKQFKQGEDNEIVRKTTMREVKILKMLNHPNIVELKEAYRKRGIVYLIFEYVRNNLLEILEKEPDGLDHELIRTTIFQLVTGLAYLHSMNIIHRDIKPENLLIGDEKQLKICDFGFARVQKKNKDSLTDYVATRWYRPPQLLVGAHYGKQIDMWAVGCILGELIDGNPMFPGENEFDQLFLIQKCLGPLTSEHQEIFHKNPRFVGTKFPDINTLETIDKRYLGKFTSKGLNFLKQLLKMNPFERLTAQEALLHPYFEGLERQELLRHKSISIKNSSDLMQRSQQIQTTIINTVAQQKRKNVNNFTNNRQKTEHSNMTEVNSTGVNKIPQKLNFSKRKKQESFVSSKGMGSFNNSTNASKSLGKTKISIKGSYIHNNASSQSKQRNISLEKVKNQRETLTKTQTGFYVAGGSIIPEHHEEEEGYANYPINRNKVYNVRSPRSRHNYRRSNLNTEEIIEQDHQEVNQSSGQLPILMVASQKSGQHRKQPIHHQSGSHQQHHGLYHSKQITQNVPNIIITNSTFNYRH